jgi:hypothetical protein
MKKFKHRDEAINYITNKCDIYREYILNDLKKDNLKIQGMFSTIVHVLTQSIYFDYPHSVLATPLLKNFLELLDILLHEHFTRINEDLIENKKE